MRQTPKMAGSGARAMKRLSLAFRTAMLLNSSLWGMAQNPPALPSVNLELHLQARVSADGIPQALNASIVNVSNHDVHLPTPSIMCGDVVYGTFRLNLNFKPLGGEESNIGSGCFNDYSYSPIRNRIKTWKVLRPGESLELMDDRLPTQVPGSYDYWASYLPPGMPKTDAQLLQNDGIDFPRTSLQSSHVQYVKSK